VYPDEPVENFGIDSVMITTFALMLEHDLGELSKTLLFEYPPLDALANYLVTEHAAGLEKVFGSMSAQSQIEAALATGRELRPAQDERFGAPREQTESRGRGIQACQSSSPESPYSNT